MTPLDASLTSFTEQDVLSCVKFEIEAAFKRYHAVSNPKAILLAGQPGAGKTVLSDRIGSCSCHIPCSTAGSLRRKIIGFYCLECDTSPSANNEVVAL